MCFAGVDDLERAGISHHLPQPVGVGYKKAGSFVAYGSARETDRERGGFECCAAASLNLLREVPLGFGVRCLNLIQIDLRSGPQEVVILPPSRQAPVEEARER